MILLHKDTEMVKLNDADNGAAETDLQITPYSTQPDTFLFKHLLFPTCKEPTKTSGYIVYGCVTVLCECLLSPRCTNAKLWANIYICYPSSRSARSSASIVAFFCISSNRYVFLYSGPVRCPLRSAGI